MQLIVLGMHRSGTSVVARLLNMMGAYFSAEGGATETTGANRKGYWERKDVIALNNQLLRGLGCEWHHVSRLQLLPLDREIKKQFDQGARTILQYLDANRPWFIKDPRLCLLLPIWLRLLECPTVILVFRKPIQVAQSLQARYGFPLPLGIALWEIYNLQALAHSHSLPRLLLHHERVLSDPVGQTEQLFTELQHIGGLRKPHMKEVTAFIDPALFRQKGDDQLQSEFLTEEQANLVHGFESGEALRWERIPPLSPVSQKILAEHDQHQIRPTEDSKPIESASSLPQNTIEQLREELARYRTELTLVKGELETLRKRIQ